MKDVFDLSLEETAAMLRTSVGAVKSALNRARGRLEAKRPPAGFDAPRREIVEQFMVALRDKDMETMRALCSDGLRARPGRRRRRAMAGSRTRPSSPTPT